MLENLEMNKLKAVTLASMLALSSGANALSVQVSELGSYAVLAGTTIQANGVASTISGNAGVSPGTSVTGSIIYTSGRLAVPGEAASAAAQKDALVAELAAASGSAPFLGSTVSLLDGTRLTPGTYKSGSAMSITGTLILDGLGDPNAEWIFSAGSSLNVGRDSEVQLVNTGTSEGVSVFWSVGSAAVLGVDSDFLGNILAGSSIRLETGANISCGRVFASAAITMDSDNAISRDCLGMDNQGLQYSAGLSGGKNGRLPSSSDPTFVSEVPIPAAAYLFASALLGLGAMKRRKA
jgi:hypothetical protein